MRPLLSTRTAVGRAGLSLRPCCPGSSCLGPLQPRLALPGLVFRVGLSVDTHRYPVLPLHNKKISQPPLREM